MQHLDEGTIHSWLDGELSAHDAAEAEAHTASCAQCAAAVAEARGFIAGASRILMALDRVPSGVIPVTNTVKAKNWAAWRAAAAIAVVALGSFAVLKDRVGRTKTSTSDSASVTAAVASAPTSQPTSVPAISTPEKTEAQATEKTVPVRTAPTGNVRRSASSSSGALSPPTIGETKSAEPARFSAGASVASMDAASPVAPKVLGTSKTFGGSSTSYEIAPGDTVVLTEVSKVELQSVVATGLGAQAAKSSAANGGRGMVKPVAPDNQRRALATQPEAQSTTQSPTPATAPPAIVAAPARPRMAAVLSAYNVITWNDSATGKVMRLSGRHSVAELGDIRRRLELARAAGAGEKKEP